MTSVRDMGGDGALVLKWRDEIAAGKRLGPRIKAAGPILESASNVERMKREGTVEPVDRFRLGVAWPEEAAGAVERVAKLGADAAVLLIWPGFSLHDELRLLVEQVGLTPMEALICATRSPAEFFGMQDRLGTIEPGKLADLVLLEADLLADIGATRKIGGVVVAGGFISKSELRTLLNDVEAAAGAKQTGK